MGILIFDKMKGYNNSNKALYSYPTSNQPVSESILASEGRESIFNVLMKAPIGLKRVLFLQNVIESKTPIKFYVKPGYSKEGTNGYTENDDDNPDQINLVVHTGNTKALDRKYRWKYEELVYVVGVHESHHIINSDYDLTSTETSPTYIPDAEDLWYYGLHPNHVMNEFKARLEYSLLFPSKSTSKSTWLNNYFYYFEIVLSIKKPKSKRERELRRLYNDLYDNKNKRVKSEDEIIKSEAFKELSFKAKTNFENGKEYCIDLGLTPFLSSLKKSIKEYRSLLKISSSNSSDSFEVSDEELFAKVNEHKKDRDFSFIK